MNIALILAGNIWSSPYLQIYTEILNKEKVKYDVISWNRDGYDIEYGIQYEYRLENSQRMVQKIIPFLRYASFVKKVVKKNKYSKLIVFNPQLAIFLSSFLIKNYKGRYVLDYRDLSIEQNPFLRGIYKRTLNYSVGNVISSPWFKKYLPPSKYYLCHNFDIEKVKQVIEDNKIIQLNNNGLILTIGSIAYFSISAKLIDSLANDDYYKLYFVGKGDSSKLLEDYSKSNQIKNVSFHGYYKKDNESYFVKDAMFINILIPRNSARDAALSNRFYNALIYKKPMIVNVGNIQSEYIEKYQLGVSIETCDNLRQKLSQFIDSFDVELFNKNCNDLLKNFLNDFFEFRKMIVNFATNN